MNEATLEYFFESILCGREIELNISDVPFFIGACGSGTDRCLGNTVQNLATKEITFFSTREQLITDFKYCGKSLEELWKDIVITLIL